MKRDKIKHSVMKQILPKKRLSYLLALIPIIALGSYLFRHAINVPFWDQWEIVPIIQHIKSGEFHFNDFWQQHNEHRLLFPRIFMLASAVLTKWDLRAEIFISFIMAIASFVLLLKLVHVVEERRKLNLPFLLPLFLSATWFSLLQFENWLWGWQIQWYLNVLAIMMVLYAVSRIIKEPDYPSIVLAIISAFIAQYSLGNGVLIWPMLILAVIYLNLGLKKISLVAIAGIVSTGLYYLNYKDPEGDPSKTLALEQPIEYIKYVSAYLGRPLSYYPKLAAALGLLLAGFFVSFCIYLFARKPERFKSLLPFIMLGLYAIASGSITGLSRLGFGLGQSLSSRYTTISSLLLVSCIVIVVFNRDLFANFLKAGYRPIMIGATFFVGIALLANMNWARAKSDEKTQYLKDIKGCTSVERPYDVCLLSAYPNKEIVSERLRYLKSIDWGGY